MCVCARARACGGLGVQVVLGLGELAQSRGRRVVTGPCSAAKPPRGPFSWAVRERGPDMGFQMGRVRGTLEPPDLRLGLAMEGPVTPWVKPQNRFLDRRRATPGKHPAPVISTSIFFLGGCAGSGWFRLVRFGSVGFGGQKKGQK